MKTIAQMFFNDMVDGHAHFENTCQFDYNVTVDVSNGTATG